MTKTASPVPDNSKAAEDWKLLFKAPQIAAKLAAAKASYADIERRYKATVTDSILADNTNALIGLEREMVQARSNVERLSIAHTSALESDALLRDQQLLEARKSQIRVVTAQLRIADKAAEAFATSLQDTIKAYAAIVEHRVKAGEAASSPIFGNIDAVRLIQDAACYEKAIFKFAEKEIARLGGQTLGVIGIGGEARFPGANPWDGKYRLQPQALPPITDELHKASDHLLTNLKAKITAPDIGVEEGAALEQSST